MPRLIARLAQFALAVSFSTVLAACQLSGPGAGSSAGTEGVTPNAVAGGEIEVTELDVLPGEAVVEGGDPGAKGNETAAAQAALPEAAVEPEAEAVAPEPAPKADLEVEPVTPKSEMQLACEKKRGTWAKVGKGELRACVFQTRDSGKQCTRESQCEGVCLARSGTCSPFKPLFGCNEILQDNGARVTLCIE